MNETGPLRTRTVSSGGSVEEVSQIPSRKAPENGEENKKNVNGEMQMPMNT